MNKEQLDELVNGIVNIEKDTMRKRFDIQSGKGVNMHALRQMWMQ